MNEEGTGKEGTGKSAGAPIRSGWKLFENGLIVFEGLGPSRRLISRVEICSEPMCDCREVLMTALSIDPEDISSAEEMEAKWSGPEAMSGRIDIDSGAATPEAWDGAKPLSSEWLEYLKAAIDPELLAVLQRASLESRVIRDAPQPHQRVTPKTGRNDFCPCGSGKKYKRCCA